MPGRVPSGGSNAGGTTVPRQLPIVEGRRAFGASAATYDDARPPYPERVYAVLRERCGLKPGTRTFEIGPGTGLATRPLLAAGAAPLVAIEPDERLAAVLGRKTPDTALEILPLQFEDAELPGGSFDLGVSATAFHWLEQRPALTKVATLLQPGGAWAMWWNVFGDPERADPFHDATRELLSEMSATPSQPDSSQHPFGLDAAARTADLEATGAFADIASRSHPLDAATRPGPGEGALRDVLALLGAGRERPRPVARRPVRNRRQRSVQWPRRAQHVHGDLHGTPPVRSHAQSYPRRA